MEYFVERYGGGQTDNYLIHYGIPRRSGRYPWGSGERPYQGDVGRGGLIERYQERSLEYSKKEAAKAHETADRHVSKYKKRADKRASAAEKYPASMSKLDASYRAKRDLRRAEKRAESYTKSYDDVVRRKQEALDHNRSYNEDKKKVKEEKKKVREERKEKLNEFYDNQKAKAEKAERKNKEKWGYTDVPHDNPLKKKEIKPNSNKDAQKYIMNRAVKTLVGTEVVGIGLNEYMKRKGLPIKGIKQATITAGAVALSSILMDEIHYARTGKLVK